MRNRSNCLCAIVAMRHSGNAPFWQCASGTIIRLFEKSSDMSTFAAMAQCHNSTLPQWRIATIAENLISCVSRIYFLDALRNVSRMIYDLFYKCYADALGELSAFNSRFNDYI